MNRLQQKFLEKNSNILTIYFTAGYPEFNDTAEIIIQLEESGADIIEIGCRSVILLPMVLQLVK
jgi:tryptophan synthase alpha chain